MPSDSLQKTGGQSAHEEIPDPATFKGSLKMRRAIMIGAILLAVSATQVAAECANGDLKGRWRYFSVTNVTNEDGIVVFAFAEACRFNINSRSRIASTDCDDDGGPGERESFMDQRIKLEDDCSFEINTEFCDYIGQVASDKETAAGVAFCGEFDRAIFNLVRE
jgi:hypothetical protein